MSESPIQANRTPFIEQPNGELTCTITIPASRVREFFAGDGVVNIGVSLYDRLTVIEKVTTMTAPSDKTFKVDLLPADTASKLAAGAMSAVHAAAATSAVEVPRAAPASAGEAEKPPTQTIGASGEDFSSVVSPQMEAQFAQWEHPAKPYLRTIFLWTPFQDFALRKIAANRPFAAPIPTAIELLTAAARADSASPFVGLGALMDEYAAWAQSVAAPVWPGPPESAA